LLPVTIALLTHTEAALLLFVALLALQQVIFQILTPRILSRQVGLHPLVVFFAVLTGARIAGVWGAIFGVPIVAVLSTMISFYRATQEERAARLLEHLPAEDLVSVDVSASELSDAALISSGKGVARP
jgi:predicted PurR-regulated permease PerM